MKTIALQQVILITWFISRINTFIYIMVVNCEEKENGYTRLIVCKLAQKYCICYDVSTYIISIFIQAILTYFILGAKLTIVLVKVGEASYIVCHINPSLT